MYSLFLYGDGLELREKLRCQELQNIWSECVALNTVKPRDRDHIQLLDPTCA